MPRIMNEMPGAPVVENIQFVFAVSFIALAPCGFHLASASLVASTGMDAARGSVCGTKFSKIFEGCVNAILCWTRLVVFLRLEWASSLAQL